MKLLLRCAILAGAALAALTLTEARAAAPAIDPTKDKGLPVPAVMLKAAPENVDDLKAMQAHVKKVLKKVIPATVHVNLGGGAGSGSSSPRTATS